MDSPPDVLRLSAGDDVAGEYEERRSRFRCVLRRVDTEEAARELVAEARGRHPDARHHCSAFLVDVPGSGRIERSSDDGEPAGTAGTPMLDVLRGSGLTGVAAVVVRWFGGTKLGTGGLVRAYGAAVGAALDEARTAGRVVTVTTLPAWRAELDHAVAGRVEAAIRATGARVLQVDHGRRVTLRVAADLHTVAAPLAELTSGGVRWQPDGRARIERPVES